MRSSSECSTFQAEDYSNHLYSGLLLSLVVVATSTFTEYFIANRNNLQDTIPTEFGMMKDLGKYLRERPLSILTMHAMHLVSYSFSFDLGRHVGSVE